MLCTEQHYNLLHTNLALADFKGLIVVVDHGSGRAGGACECDAFVVGGQLNGPLTGHGITRVEAGCIRDGAEHGKVFQGHLGGTILACVCVCVCVCMCVHVCVCVRALC